MDTDPFIPLFETECSSGVWACVFKNLEYFYVLCWDDDDVWVGGLLLEFFVLACGGSWWWCEWNFVVGLVWLQSLGAV